MQSILRIVLFSISYLLYRVVEQSERVHGSDPQIPQLEM